MTDMTDVAQAVRDQYPGNTYQDIARADGDTLPPQLALQNDPPQSTAVIPAQAHCCPGFLGSVMRVLQNRLRSEAAMAGW